MQVSVQKTGNIARKMTVEVPAERLEDEILARLKSMGKTVRIPGFRPGRAPLKVVESRYRAQVTDEVATGLIQESFREFNTVGFKQTWPSNSAHVPSTNPEPLMMTSNPPAVDPLDGNTAEECRGSIWVFWSS